MKKIKKITAAFLAAAMMTPAVFSVHAAEPEAPDIKAVQIDKTYLKAGEALHVSAPEGCTLRYFADGKEVEGDSFVLSDDYYEKWITVKAYDNGEEVSRDKAYFSRLPVIYINTDDGLGITSKDEYKPAVMSIQNNTEADTAMYDGVIKIKGRGNTSWNWPKKPYRIKLDKKTDLFGMGKNKNWVLLANYLDESLLRNTTAAQISKEMGLETMDTVWTDVVLNGEYVGNYQLCEQIRIDSTRMDIFDWESEAEDVASAIVKAEKKQGNTLDKSALEDCLKENLAWVTSGQFTFNDKLYSLADYGLEKDYDITGGYLFESSIEYDEVSEFTTNNGLMVMLNSPEFLYTNEEMMAYAQSYWNDFEAAYMSEDGYAETAEGKKHYSELADLDSMASYWVLMEIMANGDAIRKSRFAYKGVGEPLVFGPAWDFDWSSGSAAVTDKSDIWFLTGWEIPQAFYKEWLDDPVFLCRAAEKYWEVRPYLETLFANNGLVEQEIAYLSESGAADNTRWDRHVTWKDRARGFAADANIFLQYMRKRIQWLDVQFDSLSKLNKSTYHKTSAHPYTANVSELALHAVNTLPDNVSEHTPANGILGGNVDLKVRAAVKGEDTVSLNVYVNGLFAETVSVNGGLAAFAVDRDKLMSGGRKNVISIIGKGSDGAATYRNYLTVLKADEPIDLLGDVNRDGAVTIEDATLLQRYLAEYTAEDGAALLDFSDEQQKKLTDADKDGYVTIRDVTAIQRIIAEIPSFGIESD